MGTTTVEEFDGVIDGNGEVENRVYPGTGGEGGTGTGEGSGMQSKYQIDEKGLIVGSYTGGTGYNLVDIKDPNAAQDVVAGITDAKKWAANMGVDIDATRLQGINTANETYERNKVSYGQNAESLAQAGLTGSGYSDNLMRDAFATRQTAIAAVEDAYRRDEKELLSSYKDHLQEEEDKKLSRKIGSNDAVLELLTNDPTMSADLVVENLIAKGYTEEEAITAWNANVTSRSYLRNQKIGDSISSLLYNENGSTTGLTQEQAIHKLMAQGYTREEAEAAWGTLGGDYTNKRSQEASTVLSALL